MAWRDEHPVTLEGLDGWLTTEPENDTPVSYQLRYCPNGHAQSGAYEPVCLECGLRFNERRGL